MSPTRKTAATRSASPYSHRCFEAVEVLDASLSTVEEQKKRTKFVKARIERIRLFQKLLINMQKNMHVFEHHPKLNLRVNQLKAIEDLIQFLEDEGDGDWRGYMVQPGGAGKTILYGMLTRLMDVQTLVLVPRTNLLAQTKREFTEMIGIPEDDIGCVGGGTMETGRQITLASYQSHIAKTTTRDAAYWRSVCDSELVICDEAHRSLGSVTNGAVNALDYGIDNLVSDADEKSERVVLKDLERHTNERSLKLGFTATPSLVHKSVEGHFQHLIHHTPQSELVQAGILAKYTIAQVPARIFVEEIGEKITGAQEAKILAREEIYMKALKKLEELRREVRQKLLPLAFCSTIQECDKFKAVAESLGQTCSIVTGRECGDGPKADRVVKEAERKLLAGQIDIIASVDKLQVGWDFPPLNTILQMRATLSAAILLQEASRAARSFKGKDAAYIIEPKWRRNRPQFEEVKTEGGKTTRRGNVPIKPKTPPATSTEDEREEEPDETPEEEDAEPFYVETTFDEEEEDDDDEEEIPETEEPVPSAGKDDGREEGVPPTPPGAVTKIKFHKTPLTLAEAMHAMGEKQVENVCEGWKGERLRYGDVSVLREDGTVEIDGKIGVGLYAYASLHGHNRRAIEGEIIQRRIRPIGVAINCPRYVPIYALEDIAMLTCVREHVDKRQLLAEGEVVIDGECCVSVNKFARLHRLGRTLLKKHIAGANIHPKRVLHINRKEVQLYRISELESLPFVQLRSQIKSVMDPQQRVRIGKRIGIGIRHVALKTGITENTIMHEIMKAGIQSIGRAQAPLGTPFEVFAEDDLEALTIVRDRKNLPVIDEESGETTDGKGYIHLGTFANTHLQPPLNADDLYMAIRRHKLSHVGYAIGKGKKRVKVYDKKEVVNLPYVRDRLRSQSK